MPIPELEDGVVFHIKEDIYTSEHVNELLRSRSLSIYTPWSFEMAWIDGEQYISIRIKEFGKDEVWYWKTQRGWVGSDQLDGLTYCVAGAQYRRDNRPKE